MELKVGLHLGTLTLRRREGKPVATKCDTSLGENLLLVLWSIGLPREGAL